MGVIVPAGSAARSSVEGYDAKKHDAFFDGVLVNSPEPAERHNRLRLLRGVCSLMEQLADFSLIVG